MSEKEKIRLDFLLILKNRIIAVMENGTWVLAENEYRWWNGKQRGESLYGKQSFGY